MRIMMTVTMRRNAMITISWQFSSCLVSEVCRSLRWWPTRSTDDLRAVLEAIASPAGRVRVERGWSAGVNFGEQLYTYLYLLYSVMGPRLPPDVQQAMRDNYRRN